jgi:hypothetical protein
LKRQACPLCANSGRSALRQRLALFDRLVGDSEYSGWEGQAQRLCGFLQEAYGKLATVGENHMSQVLEWRERLETAHKLLHDSMTELITKKNYSEAERGLHVVDQLMLDLIEDMGGTVVSSGLWT